MQAAIQSRNSAEEQITFSRVLLWIFRAVILITGLMVFFSDINPGRLSTNINVNASLFTTSISYNLLTDGFKRAIRSEWVLPSHFYRIMGGCGMILIGELACAIGACMSLGNTKMKRRGLLFPILGSIIMVGGNFLLRSTYSAMIALEKADRLDLIYPGTALNFWLAAGIVILVLTLLALVSVKGPSEEKMEMQEQFRLLLMFLPVLLLTFVFFYLPIYGWRFAFFDYKIGDALTKENFVGFKWFTYLFQNAATRADLIRVLRNTLIMSGLGIATSWLPIAFAILLAEVKSSRFQRLTQTLTTIPNFISWVLVYAIAFAIFSADGFINSFLRNVLNIESAHTDYLASSSLIWVKMLLWGTWKGLGWSAIIYIAGIAGIDQQLYEAAKVDGANRFQCIRHITIPGLMPTYMVMLLMAVAGVLSNGMDQYLVFENPINKEAIEVLDLYVYNAGIKSGLIPLSTVVGVFKSLVGVTLLFAANGISKSIRGESII